LVFIDESGSTISMTRTHARSPRGVRTSEAVPRNRGPVTTIIGALTTNGLEATMTIEGGTDGDVFCAYLDEVLGGILRPDDLVVMDNAGAHKDPRVARILQRYGAKPVYLPPYSPELNPIELAWSKVKDLLRAAKVRTIAELNAAINTAMRAVSTADASGWFAHCGYFAHAT